MSTAISTNLDDTVAARARDIAQREHRSVSNVVANAVAVFTDLPKDLRDMLLDLRAANDEAQWRKVILEMTATAARIRFQRAASEAARHIVLPKEAEEADELALMEAASEITKEVIRHRD
jgi:hypothetical protein